MIFLSVYSVGMTDALDNIRARLIGQTILDIEPGITSESICTFVLANGTRFRLHATDLGFWVEDTAGPDGTYKDLTALITDYRHHTYSLDPVYNFDLPVPTVVLQAGVLELMAPDGKVFQGLVTHFKAEDQKLVHHERGLSILASSADMGDLWQIYLCHKQYPDTCPPELSRR